MGGRCKSERTENPELSLGVLLALNFAGLNIKLVEYFLALFKFMFSGFCYQSNFVSTEEPNLQTLFSVEESPVYAIESLLEINENSYKIISIFPLLENILHKLSNSCISVSSF